MSDRSSNCLQFIESASEMCELLRSQGFWADFIDPSSGNAVGNLLLALYFVITISVDFGLSVKCEDYVDSLSDMSVSLYCA